MLMFAAAASAAAVGSEAGGSFCSSCRTIDRNGSPSTLCEST